MSSSGWTGIWIGHPIIPRSRIEIATGRREMKVSTLFGSTRFPRRAHSGRPNVGASR